MLKTAVSGVTMASMPSMSWPAQNSAIPRKGQIKQSVSRWCYQKIPLDELCAYAAQIGLKGVDLLKPDEYEVPARHGLVCSMGYADGGEIASAMNRVENHAKIEEGLRKYIPLAAKAGVPNVRKRIVGKLQEKPFMIASLFASPCMHGLPAVPSSHNHRRQR